MSLRDDRGAIMLIAVFFAVFAVALLYYLVGIGNSVLFREKLQDAADSAVLSGAIMRARGMNLIVLINIVMAALLSVLVTIKLLETLAMIGMAIAAALAWCTFGGTLIAIPPLNSVRSSTKAAYDALQTPVSNALIALHDAAGAVQQVTPAIADALVWEDIEARSNPPGTHGIVFDTRPDQDLPVQDDDFASLCGRAGEIPIELARAALSPLPGVSDLMGELASPMRELTSEFSAWFCGDGASAPAPYVQHEEVPYPRTGLVSRCESENSTDDLVGSNWKQADPMHATSDACNRSHDDELAAAADTNSGGCQSGHDCSLGGPYDTHVALAREQCDPTVAPSPFVYFYQARSGQVEYKWNSKLWVRGEPVYEQPNYGTSNGRPPCGPAEVSSVVAHGYNKTVRNHADVNEVLPVCSSEEAPWLPPIRGEETTTKAVRFVEVLQILGCKRNESRQIAIDGGDTVGNSGNDKAPKRVQDAARLGDENFQVRAIMHGNLPTAVADPVIRLSLWGATAPENPFAALRKLGDYSFAQAEYYFDGRDPQSEWMWNMNWRARLRRFRLPKGSASDALAAACGKLGGTCSAFVGQVKKLESIIIH
jgi:hypothetical protein